MSDNKNFKVKDSKKPTKKIVDCAKPLNLEEFNDLVKKIVKETTEDIDETTGAGSSGSYVGPLMISKNKNQTNPKVITPLLRRGFEVGKIVEESIKSLKSFENSFCEKILNEERKSNSQLIFDKVKKMNKADFEKSLYDNNVFGDKEKTSTITSIYPLDFQNAYEEKVKNKKEVTDAIENDPERAIRTRGLEDINIPLEAKLKYIPKDDNFIERVKIKDKYQKNHQIKGPYFWGGTAINEDVEMHDLPTIYAYKHNKFGIDELLKFKTTDVKFVESIDESFCKLNHDGLTNTLDLNDFSFYINENNELFVTNRKIIKESKESHKINYLINFKKKKA